MHLLYACMFIVAILFSDRLNNLRKFKGKHQVNKIKRSNNAKIKFVFHFYITLNTSASLHPHYTSLVLVNSNN